MFSGASHFENTYTICFHLAFMPKISQHGSTTDKSSRSVHVNRASGSCQCSQLLSCTNLWTASLDQIQGARVTQAVQMALFPIVDAGDQPSHLHLTVDSLATPLLLRCSWSRWQQQSSRWLARTNRVKTARSGWENHEWSRRQQEDSSPTQAETCGSSLLYKCVTTGYIDYKCFWNSNNFWKWAD